jgi:hypothetical protein
MNNFSQFKMVALFCIFTGVSICMSYFDKSTTHFLDLVIETVGFNPKGTHLSAGFFISVVMLAFVLPILCSMVFKAYIFKSNSGTAKTWFTYIFVFLFGFFCSYKFIYGWN